MKREALNHTKMKRLCRRLDIPRYQGVGILEEIWKLTERESPRGDIGKLTNEDIALGIDYRGDENGLIAALVESGWMDESGEFRLLIHDWHEHCEDMIHMRIARAKEYFADGSIPKLTRLGDKERAIAHGFYFVHTEGEGVRTPSTPPSPSPRPSPPPPPPPPPPDPKPAAPPSPSVPRKPTPIRSGQMTMDSWPKTFEAINTFFIADAEICLKIVIASIQANPKITDAEVAAAVCESHSASQRGVGMFLSSVPSTVKAKMSGKTRDGPKSGDNDSTLVAAQKLLAGKEKARSYDSPRS